MIKPVLQDDDFLADVGAVSRSGDEFHVWWLGQSGFLLAWRGHFLALDPYLSDSLTKKYAQTDKPHVRMTERVVDPRRLDFVSVVTSSHNHTDHLDAETLCPMLQANPGMRLVVPEANRAFAAQRVGMPEETLIGVRAGGSVSVGGFELIGVPAAHEDLARDAAGNHSYLGYVVRFGPWNLYHSGDTLRYPGLEDLLRPWKIDLALLPINGRAPERRVAGNLNGPEAAQLASDMGARCVIPCHYELFEFNTANPEEFVLSCGRLRQRFEILRAGQHWSSSALENVSR